MKSNKISIKNLNKVRLLLVLISGILILTACRGRATPSTATPTPTIATTQTETLVTEQSFTQPPSQFTTQEQPINPAVTESVLTSTLEVQVTPRPSSTPRPVVTYVFPTDEAGMPVYPADPDGNQFFPTDPAGNPIIATDEAGNPIFPIDIDGNLIIPKNPQGTPLYPTDEFGFPILPVPEDENFPTEDLFPSPETAEFTLAPGVPSLTPRPGFPTQNPRTTARPAATIINNSGTEPSSPDFQGGTPTPITWVTPVTTKPLGDPDNPLVIGIVINREEDLPRFDSMDALARRLSDDTGFTIITRQTSSYVELLNGMRAGAVHMAWLQPFTYILAHQRGYADAAIVSNHYGLLAYGSMFLANANSDITPFFDERTNKNTGTAEEALPQFIDKRACWVDPMSASGYVVPAGELGTQNINAASSVFMMSHSGVVRALYIQGICDFGAAFALSGDPRTAAILQEDLPDVMEKVNIIWESDPVIPSLNFSFMSRVPNDIRVRVIEALIDLVQTDEGKTMLTDANAYDIRDLKEIDDTYYEALRQLLDKSNINVRTLIGK